MPQMEVAYLTQDALLWPATGTDDDGNVTIDSATGTPVRVRWVAKRMEALDRKGSTIALDALAVVDRDVPDGSILWLGTQAEWAALSPAGESNRLHQAVTIGDVPDLKGRNHRRTLGLMRYGNRLPEVA